jgi:hypothetical protein
MADVTPTELFKTVLLEIFEPASVANFSQALTSKQLLEMFQDSLPGYLGIDEIYVVMKGCGFEITIPPGEDEVKWLLRRK